ncbi:MAG TPA: prepilin-type N-terminal cleavage/methylation domain-containing protein [Gaiellaceae bacterium]|nr:prepilin-type N-terminal cleavage/methylation domain-containing protein [Gaiellaceae bacterium]
MLRFTSQIVARVRRRLEGEEGFTLMELSIVMLIFGILLTIALPSYLSLQDRANKTAAKQNLAQAWKAVIGYENDNYTGSRADPDLPNATDDGFSGISLTALASNYDASISTTPGAPLIIDPVGWTVTNAATDVCVTATVGRWTAAEGQGGTVWQAQQISVGTTWVASKCQAS